MPIFLFSYIINKYENKDKKIFNSYFLVIGFIYHVWYILPMDSYLTPLIRGIGESEAYLESQTAIARAAAVDRPILIIGERGTGKEIASRKLHYMSRRWEKSLVTVNCASLPQSLIESELFGYEKGAFTGALHSRRGRFEEADGGTLFLDEIGLIPLSVQEKILRVVEYGTFERVGSSETKKVDVRIIGATNANLPLLCKQGKFKEDLLDRLSFDVIFIPPLRERGEDILLLAEDFALRMASEYGKTYYPTFTEEVKKELLSYSWPGNIRELKNTVERALYKSKDGYIDSVNFHPFDNPYEKKEEEVDPFSAYELEDLEKAREDLDISFIMRALRMADNNQKKAAALLGITYDQFRGLYRKYNKRLKEK